MEKTQALNELNKQVNECQKCELYSNCKNKVFSKGNINAKIMLIGEAPGREENEQGLPFVGKSGKKLNYLLTSSGFNPNTDIYFCNVVKCRPVRNNKDRKPNKKEISACKYYLDEQINIIHPCLVILCGNTAKNIFEIKKSMKEVHGKGFKYNDIMIFPVYHPRASIKEQDKINDFKSIKKQI